MKKKKKKKGSPEYTVKKPYTAKQETDTVIGVAIQWVFIICLLLTPFFALGMKRSANMCLLICGILILLFSFYNFLGLIFRWDHSRVCVKHLIKATYKFDVRNPWTKEDVKDSITAVVTCGVVGMAFLMCSIFLHL